MFYKTLKTVWRGKSAAGLPPDLCKCGGCAQTPFFIGGFIPAFARCCFCIAASLLVFTSPMTSPLALLHQSYCINKL